MKRRFALLTATSLILASCGGLAHEKESGDVQAAPSSPTPTDSGSSTTANGSVTLPIHLAQVTGAWLTDFSKTTIDLNELLVGIGSSDPRDAIPPIDNPGYDTASLSDWIQDREPGVLVDIDGDVRFYPLSIMTRHEIVNDVVGGVPVAVTYCPLCNTAVTFDRRLGEDTLRLGVSGLLRNSDLVMWDDVSQSLWQQITGEGIVGEHAGEQLTLIPSSIVRWSDFKSTHPLGLVLAQEQGFGRVYGYNPYEFYSSRERPYGFFTGEIDDRYPALERVVGLTLDGTEKAYPFSLITAARVVNDEIADQPLVIFWGASDTADALDSGIIAASSSVGTGVAYNPVVGGELLTFTAIGDIEFRDDQTGSTWSILGKAVAGDLEGEQLELLPHRNEFWFAWQAFFPDADVWTG